MKLDNIFVLGDGRRISFWEDNWCSEAPLCEIFPALYSLAVTKGAKVASVWDSSRGEGAWFPNFIRPLNDWEIDEVQNFLCLLNNRRVKQEEKDKFIWKGDKEGTYTVRVTMARLEEVSSRTAPMRGFQLASKCPLCGKAKEELNHILIHCPSV